MSDSRALRITRWLILALLTAFTALPMVAMVATSIRPAEAARAAFAWLPTELTLRGYSDLWHTIPFARYLVNSLIVAIAGALLAVLVAVPAGYALARWRFPGRRVLMAGILSTLLIPGIIVLVPLFLIFSWIQDTAGIELVGSYLGLILANLSFAVPLGVWLLARYFGTVPVETQEAAELDGAGRMTVLYRIAIPMARPGIVAVGVLAFTLGWGEVLFASVLTDSRSRTLAVGLADYAATGAPQWNQLMAAALTAAVPAVLAFGYLQRVWLAPADRPPARQIS